MTRVGPCVLLLATGLAATPSAGQPVQLAELAGKTIETTAGETRIARTGGRERAQTARFRNLHEFADGGRFTLTSHVALDDALMGRQNNTFRGSGVVGKPFAFRDGQRILVLENDKLTWMRTMGEGGSMGVITLARQGGRLTCGYTYTYAKELGSANLKVEAHGGWKEASFSNVKQLPTSCKVLP